MIRLAVILFATYLTYSNIENDQLTDTLFIGVGLWAIFENRHYINICSLIMIIVMMRGAEWLLMSWLGGNNPMVFYPTNIFIDMMTVLLIMFKIPILVYSEKCWFSNQVPDKFNITRADFLLVAIYVFYLFITLLSFIEHWFRHIDDIPYVLPFFDYLFQFETIQSHYANYGVYNTSGLITYFFETARHVYNVAPTFKIYLNMLEHAVILSTSYKFMHSSKILRA